MVLFYGHRAERKIKHCRVQLEGHLFTVGNATFESLVEMVEYYQKYPLYRKVKLKYPISENWIAQYGLASHILICFKSE